MAQQILRHGTYATLFSKPLFINWPLTFMCNYNCSYCFGHLKYEKDKFPAWENYERAIDNLKSLDRPAYDVILAGGEPTLHPHFLKIYDKLCISLGKRLNRIKITTNGSRNTDFFKGMRKHSSQIETVINISIHTDHASASHLKELILGLSNDFNFSFSLMYNPAKLNYAYELFEELYNLRKTHPFNLEIATLREPPNFDVPDKRYTPQMMAKQDELMMRFEDLAGSSSIQYSSKLRFDPHEFTELMDGDNIRVVDSGSRHLRFAHGLFKFRGMHCISGSHLLRIEPNGDVRGLVCPQAKPFGNIYKNTFSANTVKVESLVCKQDNCGCLANDIVPKFLNKTEADYYVRSFQNPQMDFTSPVNSQSRRVNERGIPDFSENLGNMIELILLIRPDVKKAYSNDKGIDGLKVCEWAIKMGYKENEVVRKLIPEILEELRHLNKRQ